MAVIGAHVEMMTRIAAEEAIQACRTTAIGSGTVERAFARRTLSDLERAARGRRRAVRGTPADITAIGIAVHVVERSAQ